MSKVTRASIRVAIAIPTYNESRTIAKLVRQIKAVMAKSGVFCTVLIIDDNSPDRTGDIADDLVTRESSGKFKVQVLHRQAKEGIDKAYIAGFKELLRGGFDFIIQMDADLSHDPKYIPRLIQASSQSDFVVGSRYIEGGGTPDWGFWRKLISRLGNIYAQLFLSNKVHDYTGGFNLYSTKLLKKINLNTLNASGYGFLVELKYQALNSCEKVVEIPIIFTERQHGTSKIPKSTIFKNLLLVPKLAFTVNNKEISKKHF